MVLFARSLLSNIWYYLHHRILIQDLNAEVRVLLQYNNLAVLEGVKQEASSSDHA